jgi:diadenosine tetraphosphate (Ap4A) HIT family hydrolase
MAIIYETRHFLVQSAEFPLVDRKDGGHVTIDPKIPVSIRQELSPVQAIELMRLTMIAGEAMTTVLIRQGIDIGRLNYQDNGNWSVFKPGGPQLHYHLYGRAKSAITQKYGQTLYMPHKDENPGFYKDFESLNNEDIGAIHDEIDRLVQLDRYSDEAWGFPQK